MTQKITEVRRWGHTETKPWIVDILATHTNSDGYVHPDGTAGGCFEYETKEDAIAAETLYLAKNVAEDLGVETSAGEIRTFESGATRDTAEGKLSYVKALSPIVLQRYVQYLNAHRKQPDGSIRDFDNWKQGIPIDAYFDGLGRHFLATWLLAQGFPAKDNHGVVTLDDSLCAIIFNASGWLHELLKEKKPDRDRPVSGGY